MRGHRESGFTTSKPEENDKTYVPIRYRSHFDKRLKFFFFDKRLKSMLLSSASSNALKGTPAPIFKMKSLIVATSLYQKNNCCGSKQRRFFTVFANKTTDKCNVQLLSLRVRYLNQNEDISEQFYSSFRCLIWLEEALH